MNADTCPPMWVADPPGAEELPELAELADLGGVGDGELLGGCRLDELDRRRTEGLLIHRMVEIERRKLYAADGFTCLAGWGRGVHRWSDIEARSRRNLTKLAVVSPQVLHRLITGRLGVAQAHLLGRLFKDPAGWSVRAVVHRRVLGSGRGVVVRRFRTTRPQLAAVGRIRTVLIRSGRIGSVVRRCSSVITSSGL